MVDIETFALSNGHIGVRCRSKITKGQFICEYRGEIISDDEMQRRKARYEKGQPKYFYRFIRGLVIDASQYGNISRFVNHSCQPNAEAEVNYVGKMAHLVFTATEDIELSEEITVDYLSDRIGYIAF
jgi:SET domain-containing protein